MCIRDRAKPEAMEAAVKKGFLNATEVADYLVQHGVPFRDAHGIVGQIVIYCEDAQKGIEELSLDELLQFSPAFGPDIFSYIDYAAIPVSYTHLDVYKRQIFLYSEVSHVRV